MQCSGSNQQQLQQHLLLAFGGLDKKPPSRNPPGKDQALAKTSDGHQSDTGGNSSINDQQDEIGTRDTSSSAAPSRPRLRSAAHGIQEVTITPRPDSGVTLLPCSAVHFRLVTQPSLNSASDVLEPAVTYTLVANAVQVDIPFCRAHQDHTLPSGWDNLGTGTSEGWGSSSSSRSDQDSTSTTCTSSSTRSSCQDASSTSSSSSSSVCSNGNADSTYVSSASSDSSSDNGNSNSSFDPNLYDLATGAGSEGASICGLAVTVHRTPRDCPGVTEDHSNSSSSIADQPLYAVVVHAVTTVHHIAAPSTSKASYVGAVLLGHSTPVWCSFHPLGEGTQGAACPGLQTHSSALYDLWVVAERRDCELTSAIPTAAAAAGLAPASPQTAAAAVGIVPASAQAAASASAAWGLPPAAACAERVEQGTQAPAPTPSTAMWEPAAAAAAGPEANYSSYPSPSATLAGHEACTAVANASVAAMPTAAGSSPSTSAGPAAEAFEGLLVVSCKVCCHPSGAGCSAGGMILERGPSQLLQPLPAAHEVEPFLYQPRLSAAHGGNSSFNSMLRLYAWCGPPDCTGVLPGAGGGGAEGLGGWQPGGWVNRGCPVRDISLWQSRPLCSSAPSDKRFPNFSPPEGEAMVSSSAAERGPMRIESGAAVAVGGEKWEGDDWGEVYEWGEVTEAAVEAAAERRRKKNMKMAQKHMRWWHRLRYMWRYRTLNIGAQLTGACI